MFRGMMGVRLVVEARENLQATCVAQVLTVDVWLAIGLADIVLAKAPPHLPPLPVLAPSIYVVMALLPLLVP